MSIELPKDAEGREIPLDTVVLFSRSGEAHNIVRWIYTTDFETWTESNMWRAIAENHRAIDPELMYLTTPDSWEKLEEDLDRVIENKDAFYSTACAYMNQGGATCDGCRIHGHNTSSCTDEMFKDVVSRIRKLRSEGNA